MSGPQPADCILRNRCHVVCIEPHATMAHAAHRMRICNISSLVVVDELGLVEGILTERDVVELVAFGRDPYVTTVAQCMSRKPVTCPPDTTISEALRLMAREGVRHLPVVHEGKPIGMISMRDVLAYELEATQEALREQTLRLRRTDGQSADAAQAEPVLAGQGIV